MLISITHYQQTNTIKRALMTARTDKQMPVLKVDPLDILVARENIVLIFLQRKIETCVRLTSYCDVKTVFQIAVKKNIHVLIPE